MKQGNEMADVKRWETGVFPNDVDPMEYVEVVEAKEYDALRAERDAAVADRIEETKETNRLRDACATAADTIAALRARVAALEAALRWIANGTSKNPRDYATTAEFALTRLSGNKTEVPK